MLLAGSIAATALPLTASATFGENITIKGGELDEQTIAPSEIGGSSFTAGVLHDNITYLTKNNLWAVYSHWLKEDLYSGDIGVTVSGDKLAEKLNEYQTNLSTNYSDTLIRYKHDLAFTTMNISNGDLTIKNADLTSIKEDVFPYDINDVLGEITVDPLKEITSWTAWYNRDSGNYYDDYNYAGECTKITEAPVELSQNKEISADIVEKVYIVNDYTAMDAINYGKTIIQLHTEYKTFEIPVYDGMGNPTGELVKVTDTSNGALTPEGAGAALKGKYVLLYDGKAYKDNHYDDYGNIIYDDITTKSGLWNAIKAVAAEKREFNPANAKLVRYVHYTVIPNWFLFSSIDFVNNPTHDGITYLNDRKTDASIWEISSNETYKVLSGSSFDAELKNFLDNKDYSNVILKNKNTIYLTATNPSTKTDKKLADSEYTSFNSEDKYPVKVSDLAAKLTSDKNPDPGKKYDVENWVLWPCRISSGFTIGNKTDVNTKDKITVDHYEGLNGDDVLIYFPQTAIKLAATVTDPDVGAVPADVSAVTVTGDSSASAVKWSVNGTALTDGETFTYEKPYTVEITLTPSDGLKLTADTPVTINGKDPASKTLSDDGTALIVSYTFEAIQRNAIPAAEFSLDQPKLGEAPDTTAAVDTNANFTVSDVKWEPADGTFKADTAYTAAATLTPSAGYKFTATTTAKVNGVAVTPVLNPDGTLTVSYTFADLKANPWLDIENKLDDTLKGENPTITVPKDNPTIPESVLEKILNGTKPVIIKFEPDNGISWEILPGNFDLSKIPEDGMDLSVTKIDSEWVTVKNNITGYEYKMQITISYRGDFGFTAYLVVDLTQLMQSDKIDQNGTYYANLYLVPDKDNRGIKPEWKGSDELTKQNGKWIAKLEFTHASDWLITIDDKDKDPSKNNNNGGSGSSGGGSSRPSRPTTTTESSTPMFGGKAMSWGDILAELEKLPIGSEVTIELNGITNVPFEVINVIGERKLKTTFKFDSVRSWKLNGAEITAPAAADLSIIAINRLKTDSLRGISGYQFTMNDTNIPTGIEIAFKTEYAGQFANLYKVVDGKLTFVTCAKVGADGKVILPDIAEKGDYVAMLSELSDVLGDMNNDGVLDQKDASAILKDIVGLEQGKNPLMADFNGDGAIDQKDASAILKSIVGLA